MDWKTFIKPTIFKIIAFLILMGGLNLFFIPGYISHGGVLAGVPLKFWPVGTGVQLSWINLIVNAIFWYLVSCGVVALYHKIRKK